MKARSDGIQVNCLLGQMYGAQVRNAILQKEHLRELLIARVHLARSRNSPVFRVDASGLGANDEETRIRVDDGVEGGVHRHGELISDAYRYVHITGTFALEQSRYAQFVPGTLECHRRLNLCWHIGYACLIRVVDRDAVKRQPNNEKAKAGDGSCELEELSNPNGRCALLAEQSYCAGPD